MKVNAVLVASVAAAVLAACSSSGVPTSETSARPAPSKPATAAQPAGHGVEAPAASIPWAQVGPGWLLATWTPAVSGQPGVPPAPGSPDPADAATTLYLVSPAGGRYPITTFPPTGNRARPELVDWSGDGTRALFYAQASTPASAIIVDLHTGVQTTVPIRNLPHFTRPDGKALLITTQSAGYKGPKLLKRVDLSGKKELVYPTDKLDGEFSGSDVSTPDGTQLVVGTSTGLQLMGNDGTAGSAISIPGQTGCDPIRWWDVDAARVLARCDSSNGQSLWTVPINGDPPTPVTSPNNGQNGPDYGDMNAWKLPAGTFVQAAGACGVVFLAKVNADGTTTRIDVPDTQGSVGVIGANGAHLYLHALAGCGGGKSLIDYDPGTNTSTVLLGPPLNGGGVIDGVLYPRQSK